AKGGPCGEPVAVGVEQGDFTVPRVDEGPDMSEPSPSGLWTAYQRTTFCASVDGIDVHIHPGATTNSLGRALKVRRLTTWAYITAWNPGSRQLSRQENDARHEQLKTDVARQGFEAFEGE